MAALLAITHSPLLWAPLLWNSSFKRMSNFLFLFFVSFVLAFGWDFLFVCNVIYYVLPQRKISEYLDYNQLGVQTDQISWKESCWINLSNIMTFVQIIQYWMVQRNDTLAQWLNKKNEHCNLGQKQICGNFPVHN